MRDYRQLTQEEIEVLERNRLLGRRLEQSIGGKRLSAPTVSIVYYSMATSGWEASTSRWR